ncbi:unnamed protein product, partial [marine sediment metagenome]
DLTCTVTTPSTDADGDTVTYEYEWYKDTVLQPALTTTTTALSATIGSANTAKDETWKCVVTPNDGTEDGPSGEDQVTIGDPAVVITGLRIGHVTRDSAVVNWETNVPASSQVGFDTSSKGSYDDYTWTATGPEPTCHHAVVLAGLTEDTTYYLRAKSTDKYERSAVSDEVSFTTSNLQQPDLAYTGDTSGTCGADVTLAGTLTVSGTPLVGKTLSFICNGWTGTAVTDGTGEGEVTVAAARLGVGT